MIPNNTKLGQYVVIEEGVKLGKNVRIGHHTVIMNDTVIGDNVVIGCHSMLGIQPGGNPKMRQSTAVTPLRIESNTHIGNHVSIYINTLIAKQVFIADQASIRENVKIGEETVIGRGAIIELNTSIGSRCTIQTLAYITGDTILEDQVFVGPCVSMSNDKYMGAKEFTMKGPHIRKDAKIGNNASLLPAITVGVNAIIGAGTVVTKDVGNYHTIVGSPAIIISYDNRKDDI